MQRAEDYTHIHAMIKPTMMARLSGVESFSQERMREAQLGQIFEGGLRHGPQVNNVSEIDAAAAMPLNNGELLLLYQTPAEANPHRVDVSFAWSVPNQARPRGREVHRLLTIRGHLDRLEEPNYGPYVVFPTPIEAPHLDILLQGATAALNRI